MQDEENETLARLLKDLAPKADALRKSTIFDPDTALILIEMAQRERERRAVGRFIKSTEWWFKYLGFLVMSAIAAKVWLIDWIRGIK